MDPQVVWDQLLPDRPVSKPAPLYLRMYFKSEFIDLVRLLGYEGLPLPEGQEKFQKLIEKHGKDKMRAASEEITVVDKATDPPVAMLTEQARKLAFQMLGPPPETRPIAEPANNGPIATEPPKGGPETPEPAAAKKPRRKNAPAPSPPENAAAPPAMTTPILQQYREAKERHPDMLLLFRMGDYYELFHDDAETAAKLGLTLTTRDKTISMAGFPHHSLETYLRKLLKAGRRVAICDQVENDALTQGQTRREVTRVVTPGALIEPTATKPSPSQAEESAPASNVDPCEPPLSRQSARHFDPVQLRAEADRAVVQANHARECSEYPRYGESVYLELAAALRQLADVTEETAEAAGTVGFDRAARQTRRAAWLKRKAAFLHVQSLRKATESHGIASRRPFGQPILVGHHSERGHRRDLDRQHRKDAQAHALWKQAQEAEHAAKACESNNAIYSDDPEAVVKLRAKLAELERQRDTWKKLNAQYRRSKGDIDAMPIADALKAALKRGKESYYMGPDKFRPAASYQFQNLGAEIRRCQSRIDELLTRENATARPERRIGGILIHDNLDFQKMELRFPGKPSDEVRAQLKSWGFRWVRSAACWSRGINAETEVRLQWLAERLGQPLE